MPKQYASLFKTDSTIADIAQKVNTKIADITSFLALSLNYWVLLTFFPLFLC
jgi:hypothetical protein